jgi:hypothetical protein
MISYLRTTWTEDCSARMDGRKEGRKEGANLHACVALLLHRLEAAIGPHGILYNVMCVQDLDIYDVLDEIMDMVKPAQPGRITKADLEACKMSGVVFGMLANVEQFYQYNYRENFMHQDGEAEAGV